MVGMEATKETNAPGFMTLLSSAACEWLLIFLMFVDASLSYFLTKLARYCELQAPCILCSRIEHVLGHEKAGNYRNLLCGNHRAEISSLMSCHIHDKLADVHGMCEECFMSIAMQNKSNPESYRLLVSKLGLDFERVGSQSPFMSNNFIPGSSKAKPCSCCNKTWRSKSNVQRLLHLTPVGFGASRANVKPPLPRAPGRSRFSRRDSMRKIRDNFSGSITSRRTGNTGVDPLSHVGYTELRITSDSDSEFPFSDDDDGSSVARENIDPKERAAVQGGSVDLARAQTDGATPGDKTRQDSDSGVSVRDKFVQSDANKPNGVKKLAADARTGHDFGQRNSEQPDPMSTTALPELISLDDIPPSNVSQVPSGLSAERSKTDVPQQPNVLEAPLEVSPEKYVAGTSDIGHSAVAKREHLSELLSTTAGADILNYANPLMPNDKDLNNFGKLALNNKGRELSGMLAQQRAVSNYAKLDEDLKSLPPLLSTRETDLSSTSSPRAYGHHDGLRRSDASIFDGILAGQRAGSVERNDPGYESLDGSSVSEIEGESLVDRLKRQVEYDRKCMSSLCKELEEERSASAIAANQAMAMITRLQEEKAALHMEALQYLRMMEEQAEYDMDALEKANDLLAEKEKEVQDLETELEFYRLNFLDESAVPNLHEETTNSKEETMKVGMHDVAIKDNANASSGSTYTKISEDRTDPINLQTPTLDFEDEKLYISQCLKRLETKLQQVKCNWEENYHKEENGLPTQNDLSVPNRSPSSHEGSVGLVENNRFVCDENNHSDSNRQKGCMHTGEILLNTMENEISDINDRLEALEADRDFLEHAFNSLRSGNEGFQFIQDIARQLQELRKVECRKCLPLP